MKLKDLAFIGAVVLLLAPFFLSNDLYAAYLACNASHPYLMALLKFGILSTAGEVIGLRIKTGRYNEPGFGILPRAVVWGFLGVWIAAMMKTLSIGLLCVLLLEIMILQYGQMEICKWMLTRGSLMIIRIINF